MGWCWNSLGWGGTWGGLILNAVFFAGMLVVLGLGTVWLVRRLGRGPLAPLASDPLEIARRRLAAGEITAAEFEEIRERIQN